ncbi:PilZ domain-containing protein [Conexibacter sp. DBS9H8]|uniref:PilZ domain-containing protein n=1 Tax=Conexibacter sp. DBS9H8 TaxID=2937801 RepID=UPI00200EEB0B|nr:PilZ domain-containing protein [Conexibacter sp. DBS9H8]
MVEPRRDAWRLPHQGVGWLAATNFRAACVVEDISVSGARVRLIQVRRPHPHPLPRELSLTTLLGGDQVTVPGTVTRVEEGRSGVRLAIHFDNGDASGLGWFINKAQRAVINSDSGVEHRGRA